MAIPDGILHKPGPLNKKEWEEMRRHPMYAYEMLSPFRTLSLRWNSLLPTMNAGTAVDTHAAERGGNTLAARLFAIVDVWDALLSDRPYRKKMPRKKVIAYLREKSGYLFDPSLVDIFLSAVGEEDEIV